MTRHMILAAAVATAAGAQTPKQLPLKYSGPPTKAEISAGDLMTRLYIYADDSLMGPAVGTEYNIRATAYIEAEVRKLGLKPAGENGGYFQDLPLRTRAIDTTSTLTTDGKVFRAGTDFLASASGVPKQFVNAQVIFGGSAFDTLNLLSPDQVRGKVVILRPFMPPEGFTQRSLQALVQTSGYRAYQASMSGALAIVSTGTDQLNPAQVRTAIMPTNIGMAADTATALTLSLTTRVVEAMLGVPLASATKGMTGKTFTTDVRFIDTKKLLGRNVVAILPGSDPKLRGQYIAIGAHNDHVPPLFRAVEHDSLKIFNTIGRPAGLEGGRTSPLTPEEWAKVNAAIDSLRKVYPARMDSINNGADDDGSGTVGLLEIAEAFAKGGVKPKRSILFVWHAGEERGMWGSGYLMDHPPVSRDSIVAQINIDMIGRGAPSDQTGQVKEGGVMYGAERYVQLVGSHRLSTELGDLVEAVNNDKKYGFKLDYGIDADGHPQNIYCRSDHWSYAKWGVPVVFFTTGGHADYHQVTDEPQYIRYDHMALLTQMIADVATRAANLDHRIVVDKPKPNPAPAATCRQ